MIFKALNRKIFRLCAPSKFTPKNTWTTFSTWLINTKSVMFGKGRRHQLISTNQHFASIFWALIFKILRHPGKLSFSPPPHPPKNIKRACSQPMKTELYPLIPHIIYLFPWFYTLSFKKPNLALKTIYTTSCAKIPTIFQISQLKATIQCWNHYQDWNRCHKKIVNKPHFLKKINIKSSDSSNHFSQKCIFHTSK